MLIFDHIQPWLNFETFKNTLLDKQLNVPSKGHQQTCCSCKPGEKVPTPISLSALLITFGLLFLQLDFRAIAFRCNCPKCRSFEAHAAWQRASAFHTNGATDKWKQLPPVAHSASPHQFHCCRRLYQRQWTWKGVLHRSNLIFYVLWLPLHILRDATAILVSRCTTLDAIYCYVRRTCNCKSFSIPVRGVM